MLALTLQALRECCSQAVRRLMALSSISTATCTLGIVMGCSRATRTVLRATYRQASNRKQCASRACVPPLCLSNIPSLIRCGRLTYCKTLPCDCSLHAHNVCHHLSNVRYALLGTWEKSSGCCFDYGNAEVKGGAMLEGSMEAVYFGCGDKAPPLLPCNETAGAYVYSDLERMHEMMEVLPPKMVDSQIHFLAAFVKGETTVSSVVSGKRNASRLVIASADAGQDATTPIDTVFDGPYPTQWKSAKQGGIVLGIGGDNSPWGNGEGNALSSLSRSLVLIALFFSVSLSLSLSLSRRNLL